MYHGTVRQVVKYTSLLFKKSQYFSGRHVRQLICPELIIKSRKPPEGQNNSRVAIVIEEHVQVFTLFEIDSNCNHMNQELQGRKYDTNTS